MYILHLALKGVFTSLILTKLDWTGQPTMVSSVQFGSNGMGWDGMRSLSAIWMSLNTASCWSVCLQSFWTSSAKQHTVHLQSDRRSVAALSTRQGIVRRNDNMLDIWCLDHSALICKDYSFAIELCSSSTGSICCGFVAQWVVQQNSQQMELLEFQR